ncbi:unknown [Clostridium sp. CAG:411]|jgi:hypothetical protein|nr:unknown [Clostridium sp. CAG:411]
MNTDKIYAEQISNNCEDDIDYIVKMICERIHAKER